MLKTSSSIPALFCLVFILVWTSCQKDDMEIPQEDDFILESQNNEAELVSDDLENAYQFLNEGCL